MAISLETHSVFRLGRKGVSDGSARVRLRVHTLRVRRAWQAGCTHGTGPESQTRYFWHPHPHVLPTGCSSPLSQTWHRPDLPTSSTRGPGARPGLRSFPGAGCISGDPAAVLQPHPSQRSRSARSSRTGIVLRLLFPLSLCPHWVQRLRGAGPPCC